VNPVALAPGRILGRYELLMPIAKGGMAEVWAARLHGSRGFQRIVALKTIISGTMDDARMEQMFLQEASLASRIQHPNVAATLDLGEEDGVLYMVMEWVDGEPLAAILKEARHQDPVPLDIAVNLIGQACQGLHSAHELCDDDGVPLGIVHRDISPQNVLVTRGGTVKLVDFGIAKATNGVTGRTSIGEVKGKFAYMAPEQIRGEPVDRRSDIFSIGILLYLLTTGQHPYKAATTAHTIHRLCSKEPVINPAEWVQNYPRALAQVVLKALNKHQNARFADARELFEALARAVPQAFQAGLESHVARYLEGLLGDRGTESRSMLRLAQQALDNAPKRSAVVTPAKSYPASVGSLRALVVDAAPPMSPVEPPSETHSTLASARDSVPKAQPRTGNRLKLLVSAAALLVVATLVAPRLSTWLANHDAARAPAAPVAREVPPPETPAAAPPSASKPLTVAPSTSQPDAPTPAATEVAAAEPAVSEPQKSARRPSPRVRKAVPKKTAPSAVEPVVQAPAEPPRAPVPVTRDPLERRY
jgi:serine/threonine-protein kinase